MASIKQRIGAMPDHRDAKELKKVLDAILVDLTALRTTVAANVTDVAALAGAVDTLATKLNADLGVTDEDYSAANAAAVTASAPSALTTTS
jgi:hypothetical protein